MICNVINPGSGIVGSCTGNESNALIPLIAWVDWRAMSGCPIRSVKFVCAVVSSREGMRRDRERGM